MNTDPADIRSPHLDLGDLIAGAAAQPIDDRVRDHLAGCEQCQLEATRWNLVADGIRGLAAATPRDAEPARPRHTQRGVLPSWRRTMLVAGSVAAAFVLLVGVGAVTGLVHVHVSGPGSRTVLAAVTGCSQLQQAGGTLKQVNGSSLVIMTASGQLVTATTTPSTFVSMSGPLLSDITDGATVMVRGHSSGGAIAAAFVTVGQPFSAVNPPGFTPVQGTVSGASTAGFTLITSSGSRVRVTTSAATLVVVPHASLGQLQDGTAIFAVGHAGPDGTLTARAVASVTQLPAGGHLNVTASSSCSPASIAAGLAVGR